MLRSQFITGFSRVLAIVYLLALATWAVIIVLWASAIYHGEAQALWPYERIYADSATLLLAFVCLGAPVVSFAFSLPIYVVRYILSGFLKLDEEGIPQGDWILFNVLVFLVEGATPYLSKALGWSLTLAAFYAIDSERVTETLLQHLAMKINLESTAMAYLQAAAHGLVMLIAIVLRAAIFLMLGSRIQIWLEMYLKSKVLGETRFEAVLNYAMSIGERDGVFPAIKTWFSARHRAS